MLSWRAMRAMRVCPRPIFVVNASGALTTAGGRQFVVPGWAELKALLRIVNEQNHNTVSPRVENLARERERRWSADIPVSGRDPLTVDVGISRPTSKLVKDWTMTFSEQGNALQSRSELVWESRLVKLVVSEMNKIDRARDEHISKATIDGLIAALRKEISCKPYPRSEVEQKNAERLVNRQRFGDLCELGEGQLDHVPTTLDRIPRDTAKALIARGYASLFAGAYVFGFVDVRDMTKLLTRERLDQMFA
jgi:hypothetical protein